MYVVKEFQTKRFKYYFEHEYMKHDLRVVLNFSLLKKKTFINNAETTYLGTQTNDMLKLPLGCLISTFK